MGNIFAIILRPHVSSYVSSELCRYHKCACAKVAAAIMLYTGNCRHYSLSTISAHSLTSHINLTFDTTCTWHWTLNQIGWYRNSRMCSRPNNTTRKYISVINKEDLKEIYLSLNINTFNSLCKLDPWNWSTRSKIRDHNFTAR